MLYLTDFVVYNKNNYYVRENKLNLNNLGITNLSEIQNLEGVIKVKELSLRHNIIQRIENLDELKDLETLDLSYNQISEITGLENLVNLKS